MKQLMMSVSMLVLVATSVDAAPSGATIDAEVGVGRVGERQTYDGAIGVGSWVAPDLALTLRAIVTKVPARPFLGGVVTSYNVESDFLLVGPSLQYWIDRHLWVGAGAGLVEWRQLGLDAAGVGLDLRAGYAFAMHGSNRFSVSLEVTPARFSTGGGLMVAGNGSPVEAGTTVTNASLLVGYQFL